jgi:hypothetical protein
MRHGVAIINSVASSKLSLSRDGEYAVRFGCGTRHGLIARSLVRNSIMRTRRGGKQVTEGVCDDRLYACYLGLYVPTRPFAPLGLRTVSALLRKTLSSPRTTRLHRQRPDHTILPLALGGGLRRKLDTASGVFYALAAPPRNDRCLCEVIENQIGVPTRQISAINAEPPAQAGE